MIRARGDAQSIDEVRKKVSERVGMSGASVYRIESAGGKTRYAVYSEFFRAPKDVARTVSPIRLDGQPVGAVAGVVVQNYMAR